MGNVTRHVKETMWETCYQVGLKGKTCSGWIQTYTVSGSSREGHISIWMTSLGILRKEPFWLEFLGIWEVLGISMQ
jgi:hypothetical protein